MSKCDIFQRSRYIILIHCRISLMRTMENNEDIDVDRQVELDIKCLQILRALIYNQIILLNEEDKERDPEKYRR